MNELPLLATLTQSGAGVAAAPAAEGVALPLDGALVDDGEGSLDAALAFAAALLGATHGESLPPAGNRLPGAPAADVADAQLTALTAADASANTTAAVAMPGSALEALDAAVAALTTEAGIATPSQAGAAGPLAVATLSLRARRSSAEGSLRAIPAEASPTRQADAAATPELLMTDLRLAGSSQQDAAKTIAVDAKAGLRVAEPRDVLQPLAAANAASASVRAAEAAPLSLVGEGDNGTAFAMPALKTPPTIDRSLPDKLRLARASAASPAAIADVAAAGTVQGNERVATPSSAASTALTLSIDLPVRHEGWGREFSERVGWVIQSRLGHAQIRLNPEHLGPVEMSVEVEDQQARIQFAAGHGATRELIEQQLPRLRELLEQQGLSLEQADVGDFAKHAEQNSDHPDFESGETLSTAAGADSADETADADALSTAAALGAPNGLIDTFV